jgi:flagellar M-ring protein FliF
MAASGEILKQAKTAWGKLDASKRLVIVAAVSICMIGTIGLLYWSTRPSYSILFSNLSAEDAGTIVNNLKEQKIPYQVPSAGVIEVPSDVVYETRLQLASDGLPQGGNVGFEIFDKNNIGMSEFTQKISYRRALEGELSRTISQLSEISGARVHIVIPDSQLYEEKSDPATASVVLKTRPAANLSERQVQGIVHLIASAVEGLKTENVSVLDTSGNMLYEGGGSQSALEAGLNKYQFDAKEAYENNLQAGIEKMLGKVLGTNRAVVKVSAELDFTQSQTKSETYEQSDTPVVSGEQVTKEKYSGEGAAPSGATGVTTYSATQSGGSSQYNKTETNTNYDVSKKVSQEVKPPGSVNKLSVAVFIDDKAAGKVQPAVIEETVSAAAGIDQKRGDVLTVSKVPFDTSQAAAEQKEIEAAEKGQLYSNIGKIAGIVVLLALAAFALFRMLPKLKGEEASEEMWPRELSMPEEELGAPAAGQPTRAAREEVLRLAKERPADMAQLLKSWLVSED